MKHETVVIVDFGAQYAHLLGKLIRNLNIYSEIVPYTSSRTSIMEKSPHAIILIGKSDEKADEIDKRFDKSILTLGIPILGIGIGMHLIVKHFNGRSLYEGNDSYSYQDLSIDYNTTIFRGLNFEENIWLNNKVIIKRLPKEFNSIAHSDVSTIKAIEHISLPIYGLSFHPEIVENISIGRIIENFLIDITRITRSWTASSFIISSIEEIKQKIGHEQVILGLSGGIDSTVVATLLDRAIGTNLIPIYVNTGLMRKYETTTIKEFYEKKYSSKIIIVNAEKEFLSALQGVTDPEEKRKIIGKLFINIFTTEAQKYKNAKWLAQGTVYSDVIESQLMAGSSLPLKSHHNVGGLPEIMNLKLIEPIRHLFKDEVRKVGFKLDIPKEFLFRHPFPGPGLAIRIIGEVTKEKVQLLQDIDAILSEELHAFELYEKVWQGFAVLLPVFSVGMEGDKRTYAQTCCLRIVNSVDAMTATFTELPWIFLKKVSTRITNEIQRINKVVYDISSKPPSTIEWE